MMRANALIDLRIARPLRWLAGKSAELTDWSPISMGLVFEKIEATFERAAQVSTHYARVTLLCTHHTFMSKLTLNPILTLQHMNVYAQDGSVLLDPNLDVFADVVATQPLFREYLDHMYNKEFMLSPNGKKKHPAYK